MGRRNKNGGGGAASSATSPAPAVEIQGGPEEEPELDDLEDDSDIDDASDGALEGPQGSDEPANDDGPVAAHDEPSDGEAEAADPGASDGHEEADNAPQGGEGAPAIAAQLPSLTVGDELRCDDFDGGLVVVATVREVSPDGREALLWLPALERNWPIRAEHVSGKAWRHDAEDYPAPGENEEFDREFRPPVPSERQAESAPVAGGFRPPRRARLGYVWAITQHYVAALGYDVAGNARKDWLLHEAGEFKKSTVKDSPSAFKVV
jgi:hypothetical protein